MREPVLSEEDAKILSCIGNRVKFQYPGDEGLRYGILKDRAVVRVRNLRRGAVPYWDVVDLIQFEGTGRWIRMGYYRKPGGRLNWASQTTITERVSVWKNLLATTAREKKWFRNLLEDVMRELHEGEK